MEHFVETNEFIEKMELVLPILMPHAFAQRRRMIGVNGRFVHYTSAENGLRILQSSELWMRNTVCMTDYSEVRHGHALLHEFFQRQVHRDRLFAALDKCSAGVAKDAIS